MLIIRYNDEIYNWLSGPVVDVNKKWKFKCCSALVLGLLSHLWFLPQVIHQEFTP